MKLNAEDAQKKVVGVRLSRRKDPYAPAPDANHDYQATNVKVTIGPSEKYDPKEPQCTMIRQLKQQTGSTMVDYNCDLGEHAGQYVKFSNDQDYLTICEARVLQQCVDKDPDFCGTVKQRLLNMWDGELRGVLKSIQYCDINKHRCPWTCDMCPSKYENEERGCEDKHPACVAMSKFPEEWIRIICQSLPQKHVYIKHCPQTCSRVVGVAACLP